MTHRKKLFIVILSLAILSACSNTNEAITEAAATQKNEGATAATATVVSSDMPEKVSYADDDFAADWTTENPTTIQLNGTDVSIDGAGAEAIDGSVTITSAGTYVLSGKLDDGQIVVDVSKEDKVRLVLNSVELHNSDSAPIFIKEAKKTIITLQEGTNNIVSDGTTYTYADASTDEPNAAVFSKADLTLNGAGSLIVNGNYKDGLTSRDDLIITGGTIEIHTKDDGLIGRDLVAVKDGTLTIVAGGDGIKSTNDSEASKGNIVIEGGTFDIDANSDGLQAAATIRVDGGTFEIISGGGSVNGEIRTEQGGWGKRPEETTEEAETTEAETESSSMKAVKATSNIMVTAGTFVIDSADDAVHSNGSIAISGGEMEISSGDDGIHADASIMIEGGIIDITKSYEGIESEVVTIAEGTIRLVASDDGINSGSMLTITGGVVNVDASGDGLDSNGSIEMSGGTVIVNGPTASGNGALDYDGTFDMSSGSLVAVGSAGMASTPSESSSQFSIIMNYSEMQAAGTSVRLEDEDGKVITTVSPTKVYQTAVISSPDLQEGATYTLYSDESKVVDFEIANSVTWLNESGVTEASAGRQGGRGMGGGRGRTMPDGDMPSPREGMQRPEGDVPIQGQ